MLYKQREKKVKLALLFRISMVILRQSNTLSSANINVYFKPLTTLRHMISRVKDRISTLQKSDVVYCTPCRTCSIVYVWQSSWLIKTRVDEHKAAVKYGNVVSAVMEHVWVDEHDIDFQCISILAWEPDLH